MKKKIIKLYTGGRYIVTSGNVDLCIRVVRPEDASKKFTCLTTNTLTGERKLSDVVMLSIKGMSINTSYTLSWGHNRLKRKCSLCVCEWSNDVAMKEKIN